MSGPADPTRSRARNCADKRPQEDIFERVHLGKGNVRKQREACRIADERSECAGVKEAHDPVLLALENHRLIGKARLGRCDIVHAEPCQSRTHQDKGYPDEASVLDPKRVAAGHWLRIAANGSEHANRDDDWHDKLHHRNPGIAKPGIEREGIALLPFREEEADIGHGRGKVTATETAQQG